MPEEKFEFNEETDKEVPTSIKDRVMEIVETAYHTIDYENKEHEYVSNKCEERFGGYWTVFISPKNSGLSYHTTYFNKCKIVINYYKGSSLFEKIRVFKTST